MQVSVSDELSFHPACQELHMPVRRQQWHVNFKTLETVLIVTPKSLNRAKRTQKSRDPSSGPVPKPPQMQEAKKTRMDSGHEKYKTRSVIPVLFLIVKNTPKLS